jgi:SAM-dependent methyltransferase
MTIEETRKKINQYFTEKLITFGATAKGVDYKSSYDQEIRFEQLLRVINPAQPFTLLDYGSGYGALYDTMSQKGWRFEYYGVDLIEKMIIAGRDLHKNCPNCHFTTKETEVPLADYLVAGAIFNNKLDSSVEAWREFTVQTLQRMNQLCSKGFSFNMLTSYSDADRMAQRPDLYFGDPCFYFDYCKRNFSHNIALLHDYGLYDFTILVRKDI